MASVFLLQTYRVIVSMLITATCSQQFSVKFIPFKILILVIAFLRLHLPITPKFRLNYTVCSPGRTLRTNPKQFIMRHMSYFRLLQPNSGKIPNPQMARNLRSCRSILQYLWINLDSRFLNAVNIQFLM